LKVKGLCLEDSMLLAYTRQQLQPEEYELVRQHIGHCQQCRQECIRYTFLNQKLDVLSEMVNKEPYPETSPEATYRNVVRRFQEEERHRRVVSVRPVQSIQEVILASGQRRKSGFGWAYKLIPALLLIVVSVFVIKSHLPSTIQPNGLSVPGVSMSVVPHQSTRLPSKRVGTITTRVVPGATAKPIVPSASQPYLQVCPKTNDSKQHVLLICGYNFIPGDSLVLILISRAGKTTSHHPIIVNAQGDFQAAFTINNCKSVPTSIIAQDITNNIYNVSLRNVSFDNCPVATPAPILNKST